MDSNNKKNTQTTQASQTIQSFKPSPSIKKKGCGCGKKKTSK